MPHFTSSRVSSHLFSQLYLFLFVLFSFLLFLSFFLSFLTSISFSSCFFSFLAYCLSLLYLLSSRNPAFRSCTLFKESLNSRLNALCLLLLFIFKIQKNRQETSSVGIPFSIPRPLNYFKHLKTPLPKNKPSPIACSIHNEFIGSINT